MKEKRLTVEEMHKLLKSGQVKLRSLAYIKGKGREKGYNQNYIRDWFNFSSSAKRKERRRR